jgi:hypothetical protein
MFTIRSGTRSGEIKTLRPRWTAGQCKKLANADVNRTPRPHSRSDVDPCPGRAVIKAGQEHELAVEETAEVEVPPVFEKVATNDTAMAEIDIAITLMTNATKAVMIDIVSRRVEEVASMPQIIAIKPSKLPAVLLIEERPALHSLVVAAELAARAVEATQWSA